MGRIAPREDSGAEIASDTTTDPDPDPAPRGVAIRRRRVLVGAGAGSAAVAAVAGAGAVGRTWFRRHHVVYPLLSETVAFTGGPGGADTGAGVPPRRLVLPGHASQLIPGTRVLRSAAGADRLVAAEQEWLAAGTPWTTAPGPWAGLARGALLDLRVLQGAGGAAVAGWSPRWRQVWPRDAAHVVAALAVTGHPEQALAILAFLARAQRPDGGFEARYRPDGSGPPDGRPAQLDGAGWVLWAATQLAGELALTTAIARLGTVRGMLVRATRQILGLIDTADGLPPPSPDYWETPETTTTLGTAAPLLAGLSAGAGLLALLGESDLARAATAGAGRLGAAIDAGFGSGGYPRHLHGSDRDAAVAFLLPPYAATGSAAAKAALAESAASMSRPGGGLAPGSAWHDDGSSWTPETALFALAAAATGDTATAHHRLDWLQTHRTAAGSLPEQVLYDGRPASVAPLAWTAALVLLTLNALQTAAGTGPTDLN